MRYDVALSFLEKRRPNQAVVGLSAAGTGAQWRRKVVNVYFNSEEVEVIISCRLLSDLAIVYCLIDTISFDRFLRKEFALTESRR